MPTILWKNLLKLCLPTTVPPSHPSLPSQQDHSHPLPSSSSSSSSSSSPSSSSSTVPTSANATSITMIKNFNSIYELSSSSTSKSLSAPSTDYFTSSDSDSDTDSPLPDFSTVFASQRFFFSSPGQSSSIIESRPDTTLPPSHHHALPLRGGVAVKKYSPDPYEDFKNSMKEMIEARGLRDVRADLDYLHELLSCYLILNPKHTHKFIISAFADTIIFLLSSSSSPESSISQKFDCRRQPNVSHQL